MVPKVLITTAPYGSGHDRVAAALAQALGAAGATAEIVDHFERFVSQLFARASRSLFWAVLQGAPWMWGWAYTLSGRLPTRSRAMAGMDRIGARALARYLATARPDVVVHVHPTAAGALAWLRIEGRSRVPQAVVLTDFAAHPQWIYPEVDRYFAPSEPIREELIARGVPAERVVTSGIPIDRAFRPPADRGALRAALGLAADLPTPLVMGGMQGRVGGLAEACEVLRGVTLPFQALVVCGSHHGLADHLRARLAGDDRFRVFGRVTDIHRLMGAADFVVTKAGASTCAEALALERPLLFYRSLPGQEQANERAVEQAGAGLRAADAAALRRHIEALLQDPRQRTALASATERLRRPDAADTVAKELLALTGAPA